MPTYHVVVHKDGQVLLLTGQQMFDRAAAAKKGVENKDEAELGEFTAENGQEARRLFLTENPMVDADSMRIPVNAAPITAEAEKAAADARMAAMEEAVKGLKVPVGSDPDAYSDEAHIARGEMQRPEDYAQEREDARAAAEGRPARDVKSAYIDLSSDPHTSEKRFGNTGKAPGQKSSRGETVKPGDSGGHAAGPAGGAR